MILEQINYITILDYFKVGLIHQSENLLVYQKNKMIFIVYKNSYGALMLYSVGDTKNLNNQDLINLLTKKTLNPENFQRLLEKLYSQNKTKETTDLIKILKEQKLPNVLNYVVQLKKVKSELLKKYQYSFLIDEFGAHDENYLKLKLKHISDLEIDDFEKLNYRFYDYLILNTEEFKTQFNKPQSVYFARVDKDIHSSVLDVFHSGSTLLKYSQTHKFNNDIILDLDPVLNLPKISDFSLNYEYINLIYEQNDKYSMLSLLEFLCVYISYSTGDVINLRYNGYNDFNLVCYLRGKSKGHASLPLKTLKGVQINFFKKDFTLEELATDKDYNNDEEYNTLYKSLEDLSKKTDTMYYLPFPYEEGEKPEIKNFNVNIKYPFLPHILTDLVNILRNYYEPLTLFNFKNINE